MTRTLTAALALALASTMAIADDKPSDDEAKKIAEAAAGWGCTGGVGEKESEATGVLELNDAKCKDGANYDLKFDKAYKIISITAD